MPADRSPMVMRSVYLPQSLDNELRRVAFVLHSPKAELIRRFVATALQQLSSQLEDKSPDEIEAMADDWARNADAWTQELEQRKERGIRKLRQAAGAA